MKFRFDKVTTDPPFALTKSEAKHVFEALPAEWLTGVSLIHFSNAAPGVSRYTWFDRLEGTLIVFSRGRTRRSTIEDAFTELAACHLGFKQSRWQRPSKLQAQTIKQLVDPLVEAALATFPKPKPNPVFPAPLRAPYGFCRNT